MQLKQQLKDQLSLLQLQQEQITQAYLERDAARQELRKFKTSLKEASIASFQGGSSNATKSKRIPLVEVSNNNT